MTISDYDTLLHISSVLFGMFSLLQFGVTIIFSISKCKIYCCLMCSPKFTRKCRVHIFPPVQLILYYRKVLEVPMFCCYVPLKIF